MPGQPGSTTGLIWAKGWSWLSGGIESPFPRWEAKLQALDPEADYDLFSWDDRSTRRMTGEQLMMKGFDVTIGEKPGSALFTYKRVCVTSSLQGGGPEQSPEQIASGLRPLAMTLS